MLGPNEYTIPINITGNELTLIHDILKSPSSLSDEIKSLIVKIIGHKKKCWAHENELRFVSIGNKITELKDSAIKKVYFGVRMPLHRKEFYKKVFLMILFKQMIILG